MDGLGGFLFLLGFVVLSSAEFTKCPPNDFSSVCYCNYRYFPGTIGNLITCHDINSSATLLEEIQKLRDYPIHTLRLTNLQLPYLPAGLFLGMSVQELIIKDSVLDNLYSTKDYKPSPFAGLENSLEELAIYSTKDPSKWYWPDLKNMKKLKNIEIVQSPIDFVGHVFAEIGEGSVESITVAYSRVYRIHPQAFPELTNLKEVNFRGNFIPYMVRTMFPDPAPQLMKIDLSDNKLFTLPENMFDNMPVLEFLDLSQNDFRIFQNLPPFNSLKSFYISRNPFECGCHLLPLKQKWLAHHPKLNDIDKVTCQQPGDYREIFIKDMSEGEFHCH